MHLHNYSETVNTITPTYRQKIRLYLGLYSLLEGAFNLLSNQACANTLTCRIPALVLESKHSQTDYFHHESQCLVFGVGPELKGWFHLSFSIMCYTRTATKNKIYGA